MDSGVLYNVFSQRANQYIEGGCSASLISNEHMNDYDGEAFDSETVKVWLHKFAERFSASYQGGSRSGDIIMAAVKLAKDFINQESLPLKRSTVEAIMVDYLNYVAGHHCGMDLALYTSDMK